MSYFFTVMFHMGQSPATCSWSLQFSRKLPALLHKLWSRRDGQRARKGSKEMHIKCLKEMLLKCRKKWPAGQQQGEQRRSERLASFSIRQPPTRPSGQSAFVSAKKGYVIIAEPEDSSGSKERVYPQPRQSSPPKKGLLPSCDSLTGISQILD